MRTRWLRLALILPCSALPLLSPCAAADAPPPAAAPTATAQEPPPSTARPAARTMAEILAASSRSDWRALDPQTTLYLELPAGRVVLSLAAGFAPAHAANIKALVREGYFDGLAIIRSQDNYVVQWGDPNGDDTAAQKPITTAKRTIGAEFDRPVAGGPAFTRLPDGDVYAPEVGFADGFPAARDPKSGRMWLTHCYGMVGAARGNPSDSGGGTELYAIIGHAPRHLDRNITLVGRIVAGMELLSVLPRGTGPLGFYEKPEQRVPIRSVKVAADVPEAQRTNLEALRTDTPTFAALVEARRNRREEWFKAPAGHIELCNVPLPVRPIPPPAPSETPAKR